MLYLTGWSYGEGEFNNDYGTIAVDALGPDAGRIVWSARYDGVGVHAPDQASALIVSPDDKTVFVTGMSDDVDGGPPFDVNYGYATLAYNALTGEQLWEARKYWNGNTFSSPTALTIDPDSQRLIVTGQVGQRQLDLGTVTYNPLTGQESWSDQYGLPEHDFEFAQEISMDPRGDVVYVSGISAKSPPGVPGAVLYAPNADQLTVAYEVMTGQKRWLARFNPDSTDFVSVQSVAMSPDATRVYTGSSIDDQNWDNDGDDLDAGIVAYDLGGLVSVPPPPSTLEFTGSNESAGQYSDQTTIRAGSPTHRATRSPTDRWTSSSRTRQPRPPRMAKGWRRSRSPSIPHPDSTRSTSSMKVTRTTGRPRSTAPTRSRRRSRASPYPSKRRSGDSKRLLPTPTPGRASPGNRSGSFSRSS